MFCTLCNDSKIEVFSHTNSKLYYKCDTCSLIFLDPKYHLSPAEEKRRYQFHNNNPNDEKYRNFLSQLVDPLISILKPGDVGLDYGCGPGPTLSKMLEREGFKCKNYDPYFYPNPNVLKQQYDFITCTEVVEHFRGPRSELRKINSLVKTMGIIAVMSSIYYDDIDFENWYYTKDPTHVSFYTAETFKYISKMMGWKIVFEKKNVIIFRKTKEAIL